MNTNGIVSPVSGRRVGLPSFRIACRLYRTATECERGIELFMARVSDAGGQIININVQAVTDQGAAAWAVVALYIGAEPVTL